VEVDAHQRAAISGRESISGPNTRWLPPDGVHFPIEKLAGNDAGRADSALVTVDPALYNATGGSEEYATPISRAKGQVIRLLPFSVVWLVLGVGLTWLLGLTWPYLLVWFSVLTAGTYLRMNRDELEYSRNGLERRRVDKAAALREKELDQTHELKKIALAAYLEIARNQYLGDARHTSKGVEHDTD